MISMAELYQSVIVEHDRSPRNFRHLEHVTHHAEGTNPLCGDEVSIELDVTADGQIRDIAFQGSGCALSRASASMMTTALKGHSVEEARALFRRFHQLVTSGEAHHSPHAAPPPPPGLGKLAAFRGVAAYPMRVKCATMAWHAMKAALDGGGGGGGACRRRI